MLKNIPLMIVLAASLTACGGSDGDKKPTPTSVAPSSTPASVAASSTPASVAASSTPASSEPASSTPASSAPEASSTPASSAPEASSTPASSSSPESSSQASSSSAATFDGTFTDESTISFWSTSPNWATPTGTATQAIVNGALVVTPTWTATSDAFNVEATLPHALDLTGATISFKVYIPESYVADGKLAVQPYFKDATGKFANGGWKETAWGPWRYSGSETSTTNNATDNKFGWATLEFVVSAGGLDDTSSTTDSAAWGYNPDGLDITKVTNFGIELVGHGKPINVTGDIKIDDVVLPGL
jgi:hypothetical protein